MSTETTKRQKPKPICQRGSCPVRGTTYSEASRRCTIEVTQECWQPPVTLYGVTFMTILSGLAFPQRQMTVDLCVTCYHTMKQDKALQLFSVVGIGPYAEGQP
jgi:hypothetical protein